MKIVLTIEEIRKMLEAVNHHEKVEIVLRAEETEQFHQHGSNQRIEIYHRSDFTDIRINQQEFQEKK